MFGYFDAENIIKLNLKNTEWKQKEDEHQVSTTTHFLSRDRSRPRQNSRLTETSRCIRGAEWGWLRSTSHVVFVTRDFMDRDLASSCGSATRSTLKIVKC